MALHVSKDTAVEREGYEGYKDKKIPSFVRLSTNPAVPQ